MATTQSGGSFLPNDGVHITGYPWSFDHFNFGRVYYGASGVIPPQAGGAVLTGASAQAMTLAAPPTTIDGDVLVVTSQTAQAHTITSSSLLADGTTSAPHTTATFLAGKGATVVLMAINGLWNVVSLQNVTIS